MYGGGSCACGAPEYQQTNHQILPQMFVASKFLPTLWSQDTASPTLGLPFTCFPGGHTKMKPTLLAGTTLNLWGLPIMLTLGVGATQTRPLKMWSHTLIALIPRSNAFLSYGACGVTQIQITKIQVDTVIPGHDPRHRIGRMEGRNAGLSQPIRDSWHACMPEHEQESTQIFASRY